jgi:hypothetical protein
MKGGLRFLINQRLIPATGLFLLLLISQLGFSQQDWEKEGGIPNAEIEIIKDRQITLPSSDRNFDKVPPRPAEPVKPDIDYQFRNLNFETRDFNPAIRPLRLKQEEISKIYGNSVSAGFGNYSSPYLEGSFGSKRSANQFYGVRFYQRSFGTGPVDGKNSASSASEISLYGKSMTNQVAIDGSLNYDNRGTYFYGYAPGAEPTSRDIIRQSYNVFGASVGIENAKPTDFNYTLRASYSDLGDHYRARETETGLVFNSSYKFTAESELTVKADLYLINRTDSLPGIKPRDLFRLKPYYHFKPIENLWLTIGANAAIENDTIGKSKPLRIYPNLRADYELSKSVIAYAALTGDIDKVSLHTLSAENLWVNSNINIFHTNRTLEFLSGLKGSLGKRVAFGAGVSVANFKNLYFYVNDASKQSKFDVIYDQGNTQRINLSGELGYNPGENVKTVLRADYFHYSTDKVPVAYHRPGYRITFNSSYNIYKKVLLNVDFIGQGGIKALDYTNAKTITLKPALDLNARVDYFVSRRVSAFLKFNNILSNNYQVYFHYPVRGFQGLGGISWSF